MCRDNPCLLCRFFGADGGTRCNKKEPFLKVLAVCFCGRHAGDQGSERTDWAGLEPPLSPGILLFNHSAAKQSDGELHMPLVSLVSLPLLLSPSSSLSLSFTLFSLSLSLRFALRPHRRCSATPLLVHFTFSSSQWPLVDFVVKFQTAARMHFLILQHKVNTSHQRGVNRVKAGFC